MQQKNLKSIITEKQKYSGHMVAEYPDGFGKDIHVQHTILVSKA